jgi:hypothetical protein
MTSLFHGTIHRPPQQVRGEVSWISLSQADFYGVPVSKSWNDFEAMGSDPVLAPETVQEFIGIKVRFPDAASSGLCARA